MSQYRSIESIMEEVRRRADRPSSTRPTNDDLYAMARESWRSLHSLLNARVDQARDFASMTVSVVAGTRSYDLPVACWKVIGVKVADSSYPDGYRILDRFQWDERHDYRDSSVQYARYDIRGSRIYFSPTPGWSGTVTVEYIPYASWAAVQIADDPTTASTQITGAGNTTWRVNLDDWSGAVGNVTHQFSAQDDYVVHSGSCLLTNGQSIRAALVAKNLSGAVTMIVVKGAAAATGTEIPPTTATIQTAAGVGNSWTRIANLALSRTGDTTLSQSQGGAIDCIDASNGVDEWLVCDVAAKLKAIDEEDASYFVSQRELIAKRLMSEQTLDIARPKQVVNAGRRSGNWWWAP